jgi:hypothetical protein
MVVQHLILAQGFFDLATLMVGSGLFIFLIQLDNDVHNWLSIQDMGNLQKNIVVSFDYSLRDAVGDGNSVCVACPSSFAFMFYSASSSPQNLDGSATTQYTVPGLGLTGVGSYTVFGIPFDHFGACNTRNISAKFHSLYLSASGNTNSNYSKVTPTLNSPLSYVTFALFYVNHSYIIINLPRINQLLSCSQDHHVDISITTSGGRVYLTVVMDGVTTFQANAVCYFFIFRLIAFLSSIILPYLCPISIYLILFPRCLIFRTT